MTTRCCRAVLGVAFLLVVTGLPSAQEPSEHAEARLVRMPVWLDERAPQGCDGIVPGEIQLSEDGRAVEVTHFEPKRLRAVHAVLVDTGPNMLDMLQAVRKATAAYAESLPSDESALLATFDDQLVLHSALSASRPRFRRSLEWIETGFGSRIWDSLDRLIRYLASRPEHKVLVLLTHGCEIASRSTRTPAEVAAAAARTESLVVFAVGLDLPGRCERTGENPLRGLELLAKQTGGEVFLVSEGHELDSALAGIRLRTDHGRYLTYKPLAFGQGPRDEPAKQDFRWRKRKVRFAAKRPCEISIAGPAERYESLSRRYPHRAAAPASDALARPFMLNEAGDRLEGRLRETGLPVSVLVPPLDRVAREDAGFEAPLLLAAEAASRNEPLLVDGHTLLDLRESLAAALAGHPRYRDWVRQKVRQRRLREIDALIREADDGRAEMLRRARRMLDEQQWEPEAPELQSYLADWLGDIWSVEALNVVERWLASRILAAFAVGGADDAARAASDAEQLWPEVWSRLRPSAEPPIVGLLVPGYDPLQETIGYYRILRRLPRSARIHSTFTGAPAQRMIRAAGGEDDSALHARFRKMNFSEVALGARLMRWMLERPPVAAELVDRFDVDAVRYAHASTRDLLPVLQSLELAEGPDFEGGYPARQVTLALSPRDDPDQPLPVSAYFAQDPADPRRYADDPVCLVLPADPRRTAALRLLRALVRAGRASPVPCLLEQARFDTE